MVIFVVLMEFDSSAWVNVLRSAHKTALIQDGKMRG